MAITVSVDRDRYDDEGDERRGTIDGIDAFASDQHLQALATSCRKNGATLIEDQQFIFFVEPWPISILRGGRALHQVTSAVDVVWTTAFRCKDQRGDESEPASGAPYASSAQSG